MKRKILLLTVINIIVFSPLIAQGGGEKIFFEKCTACHTIGEGKRVGPDLANVHQRREQNWIVKFIQSSQSLIKSGDSLAAAVFEENNKVIMPDQPLNESEIKSVIEYISTNSPDPNNPNIRTPKQIFDPTAITQADIDRGKKLFEGTVKFENGGAPCIVCHNVQLPGMLTGGTLAKDLTVSFTRLSPAGVDGIIRNPPFPAMVNSFANKPLADQEVKDLLAFLYYSDDWNLYQNFSGNGNIIFLAVSIFGLNIVFLFFLWRWRKVKKHSVNFFRI
ncbi:MAG: cytochrome c [Melioribacteraceae bacterium]|nr:cytochrome c [Melioribacteraceae bacterium]MCF8354147.1 cytochrome c [Melioribacteraceae bacterium]MCF8393374.1 cytochrome c [Melioribacteraceae bacterium]MCF8418939.1 cytochrome c [Melioribacteraceae bacterium]